MKRLGSRWKMLAGWITLVASIPAFAQSLPHREIAITIDDLPATNSGSMSTTEITEMTGKLLATLREQRVPAVGFVNERKIYKDGEADARIHALDMWLDGGFELGNHTFAHTSLNAVTLRAWEDDVVRGESVTRVLQAKHNMKMKYFRHPYLDTGRDLQTRREAEAFLVQRGYTIAPVTMDAWDWNFGKVYEDARKHGDKSLQKQLVDTYFSYTDTVFDYYEKLSKELIGYEPKQILLLHGNWLEAEHIGELLELLRRRGYSFISLQVALSDSAYSVQDEYAGADGTGWIDHWAITRGQPPKDSPVFPAWVDARFKALPPPPLETQPF